MFQLEMYATLARDRQRDVLEQARTNALLRQRKTAMEAVPFSPAVQEKPHDPRRQSALTEAHAAEGNR